MCFNGLGPIRKAAQAATPASTLLAQLDLVPRVSAEVEDLHSRPIATTPVLPLVTGEHRVPTADAA